MLEQCTGFITRRKKEMVETVVAKAEDMCSEIITSDNYEFLLGRCHWTLAKLYRYMNEHDRAMQCIEKARSIQYGIAIGEDTALTNYCYACISLDFLARKFDPGLEKRAKNSLERAIVHAQMSDYGLDLSHPRIRLAQLHLGSSPFTPGTKTDCQSIQSPRNSLSAVERDPQSLPLRIRTQCIYEYTMSDLCRNSGQLEEAVKLAESALRIAEANNFETEIISAKARLHVSNQQPQSLVLQIEHCMNTE